MVVGNGKHPTDTSERGVSSDVLQVGRSRGVGFRNSTPKLSAHANGVGAEISRPRKYWNVAGDLAVRKTIM